MYNKDINIMPLKVETSSVKVSAKQTSSSRRDKALQSAAKPGAFNPPMPDAKATLSTKKVSYSNPFTAFLYFILSILQILVGSDKNKESPSAPTIPEAPRLPTKKETARENPEILQQYELKLRSLIPPSMPQDLVEQFIKSRLDHAKVAKDDLFSAGHEEALILELNKLQATKYYSDSLLQGLKTLYAEQRADEVFHQIYPSYQASLQKLLENPSTNVRELKKPLAAVAKKLISELENPVSKPLDAVDEKAAEVKSTLEKIQKDLAQGALIPVREHISKKYPGLEEKIAAMPAQKKEFELLLSRAWIKKELRNLSAYQGTKLEYNVLKNLGYDVSSHDDKKFLQEMMETTYLGYEKNSDLPSLETLQKEFKKMAFTFRLRAANVPQEAIPNLRELMSFYHAERQKLISAARVARDKLVIQSKLPSVQSFIRGQFYGQNLSRIENHLAEFLRAQKDNIRKNLSSAGFKTSTLPPPSKGLRFKMPADDIRRAEAWFAKYEGMIRAEFTQGEDGDDDLGEGVCLALCYRMARAALDSPDISLSRNAIRSIDATDRKFQAASQVKKRQQLSYRSMPVELLAEHQLKEEIVFIADGDQNVGLGLVEHLQHLKDSNGGLILTWGEHATFMRFDPEQKKFSFFDPNFNTIVFLRKSDESLEQLAARMATAYLELYQWAYPDRTLMAGRVLSTLKAGEAIPTGEMDLSKIPIYD